MVHQEKPQQMLRLFCCTIPFGTDSHFARTLVFASRGLGAKNAPQEHFLNAPTDGAPDIERKIVRFGVLFCKL